MTNNQPEQLKKEGLCEHGFVAHYIDNDICAFDGVNKRNSLKDYSVSEQLKRDPNLCIDCDKVRTDSREDNGDTVCVVCHNKRYYKDLRDGKTVELRLRLSDYSQGTLEEVKMVLAKNKL